MQSTLNPPSITFAVDDVVPATERLAECRIYEALTGRASRKIESCSDYHGNVVSSLNYQPLLAAVYTAFSQHRPLVLSPDAVWITIAQGIAHHMAIHGERLRSRFVGHQGKLELIFECRNWVAGSPENLWPEGFASWTEQIRSHVGAQMHDLLVCDFSTTGPIERTVSQIVMMDVFEHYFHYALHCICGIPTITLEGSTADWQRLADKAKGLRVFDIDWWLQDLLPICDQFVRASRGDVDLAHWRRICKLREAYGGHIINGWVARLFPYLRKFMGGPCTEPNPIFETGEGFTTRSAPSGLSQVPFTWRDAITGKGRQMEAIAGLVGVCQEPNSLALKPKAGWAVRQVDKLDVLLSRLKSNHRTFPGAILRRDLEFMPRDLAKFYQITDGAELRVSGSSFACRIGAEDEFEKLSWGKVADNLKGNRWPNGQVWYRFAWMADASWLAINPRPGQVEDALSRFPRNRDASEKKCLAAICHCSQHTVGRAGENPVVALSFTELLERLLDNGGHPYWLDSEFSYGDAEEFMRRS